MNTIKINDDDPDHHIYQQGKRKMWWINYMTCPTPHTMKRMRYSLETRDVVEARRKRDEILRKELLK